MGTSLCGQGSLSYRAVLHKRLPPSAGSASSRQCPGGLKGCDRLQLLVTSQLNHRCWPRCRWTCWIVLWLLALVSSFLHPACSFLCSSSVSFFDLSFLLFLFCLLSPTSDGVIRITALAPNVGPKRICFCSFDGLVAPEA